MTASSDSLSLTTQPARPSHHLGTARAPRRTARRAVPAFLLMLLVGAVLLVSACGGGTDPQTLAEEVVATWSGAMERLVSLLQEKPEVAAVEAQVQTLKEDTIQDLVALGRQRETLTELDKGKVDSLEWSTIQTLADEPWYSSYNDIWNYYSGVDLEFANLLASFNTLTQYSDFELLRQQLPEEATRLGVD